MASASSSSQALKRLAKAWPTDLARPTLQFNQLLQHIAESSTPSTRTIGAVKALEDNVLAKKYTVSARTTRPASFPEHYNRLVLGYENALKGKTRSYFQIMFGIYK